MSIVITMILRDESKHVRANLPLWMSVIDYGVFLVDDHTTDDTAIAIADVLSDVRVPYIVESYSFNGFGPSRTLSLQRAWKYFPNATHVWIADPDWVPMLDTIR
jgi:hypothetical protein